ncbi:MAG: hypothetical protein Q4E24_02020, partial [bacterium]|nr:hypothetical protein [bacterium]
ISHLCIFSIFTYILFYIFYAIHPTPQGVGFSHIHCKALKTARFLGLLHCGLAYARGEFAYQTFFNFANIFTL